VSVLGEFHLLIAVAGLVTGFLVGLTGVGGGTLLTPFLVMIGVPVSTAVGTDLCYGSLTKLAGTYQHWRQGNVQWTWVKLMATGSVPSAVMAVFVISFIDHRYAGADRILKVGLGAVLVIAAVAMSLHDVLRRRYAGPGSLPPPSPTTIRTRIILSAMVIGFLVGLTSVGSGSLVAIALLVIGRLPPRMIVGTDIAHALLLVTAAALAHYRLGNVNVTLVLNLTAGSLPGVILGSRLAQYAPKRTLRWGLAVLILAGGVKTMASAGGPRLTWRPAVFAHS
jgi:uncharacterized membrane protein YfcA